MFRDDVELAGSEAQQHAIAYPVTKYLAKLPRSRPEEASSMSVSKPNDAEVHGLSVSDAFVPRCFRSAWESCCCRRFSPGAGAAIVS